jgi:hypothetical protein
MGRMNCIDVNLWNSGVALFYAMNIQPSAGQDDALV